jgi:hypothetical protein
VLDQAAHRVTRVGAPAVRPMIVSASAGGG